MTTDTTALSPHETKILVILKDGAERVLDAIVQASGLKLDQTRSAVESLKSKALVEQTRETKQQLAFLTQLGRDYLTKGTPEVAILRKVGSGQVTIAEAQDVPFEKKTAGAAFGYLKQNGFIEVASGTVKRSSKPSDALEQELRLLESMGGAEQGYDWSLTEAPALKDFRARYEPKKRGGGDSVLELRESTTRAYRITDEGRSAASRVSSAVADAPAALTKEMLKTGQWKQILETTGFRPYAIAAPPVPVVGRRDPYREFLDSVKRTLIGLGFEEMTGSLVETEFWDMDALFLPQFHPAREIHDVYFLDDGKGGYAKQTEVSPDEAKAIEAVAVEHEGKGKSGSRGWGYAFDRERTKRCVLRSQGTVLSARWLSKKDLRNPGKYFAMARCFRYDTVDATHAPDFFQVEGIVVSEKTSFRHLLGLLKLFALEVARAPEVKFVPAYFPFTEPSVEVHMKHPTLGWMELGGAGIFRPEVTLPHGVTSPVIAWGLGLDRMAMVALGIRDIRELFTNNVPNGLAAVRERVGR
jgi:phenylalanyl-tRNA synthetase alpha chain